MAMAVINNKEAIQMNSYGVSAGDFLEIEFLKNKSENILNRIEINEILTQLMNLGKAYRKLHFCKMDSGKFYNIALDEEKSGICDKDGNLDTLFLNMINNWEQKINNIYSELFRLTRGNRSMKFYQVDNKALYMEDIFEVYEEISSIPYMGEFCGRIYSEANKLFACNYNENEFIKAKNEFQPIWTDGLNKLDKVLLNIDMYMSFNNVVCEALYCENKLVDNRIAI